MNDVSVEETLGLDWQIVGFRNKMKGSPGYIFYEYRPTKEDDYRLMLEVYGQRCETKGLYIRLYEELEDPFGGHASNLFKGWVKDLEEVNTLLEKYHLTEKP